MMKNRVSPIPPKDGSQAKTTNVNKSDWGRKQDEKNEETLRRRRRRSFEAGTQEYAAYIEKRVFNKREAWRPYLWERKR